jgi:hypothetical protein
MRSEATGEYRELMIKYRQYNQSFRKTLVYKVGGDVGFFGEYNNMLLAILYCLDNGIRFTIYSNHANFGYQNGWTDYFESFCAESRRSFHAKYNFRLIRKHLFLKCYDKVRPILKLPFLTQDLWLEIRQMEDKTYDIPEVGIKSMGLREALHLISGHVWRFNQETRIEVSALMESVSMDAPFVGFHIRRGDKYQEYPLYPIDHYVQKAEALTDTRNAFVLTDDYRVFRLLCSKYPSWTFSTLCETREEGYFHNDFMKQSRQVTKVSLMKLLASVEILARSEHFIGTLSASPGMYLGIRMNPERCHYIDFNEWQLWWLNR